jgi:hypothetical protein
MKQSCHARRDNSTHHLDPMVVAGVAFVDF